MRILFSGGGTGGHIYPALAVINKLEDKLKDLEVLFVGTEEGLEADIIPREGYNLKTIPAEGLPRKISLKSISAILKTGVGLVKARKIIKDFKPDVVVGTGGYVCGPTVLAAAVSKIPTLIHEQNAYPGLTNRLLARVVDKIALTSKEAEEYFSYPEKISLTGNPVRPEILAKKRMKSFKELGLSPWEKVILVVGGSRGARSINQALMDIYSKLRQTDWQLIHVTGKKDFSKVAEKAEKLGINDLDSGNIIIKSYLYEMEAALTAADLIISRAGATILAEITACGLPAVLIPYPYAAENHQEYNAKALEKAGAARVILDDELSGDKLFKTINQIMKEEKLRKMAKASKKLGKPEAAAEIANLIIGLGS